MNRLKTVVKQNALNEEDLLRKVRSSRSRTHKEVSFMSFKKILPIGLAAALIIAVIASWSLFVPGVSAPVTTGTAAEKEALSAYAAVEITYDSDKEIETIKILTDESGRVESVLVNDEPIDQLDLKGQPVGQVIKWAKDQGLIVDEENEDSIVLVTTTILDADKNGKKDKSEEDLDPEVKADAERNQESIGHQIQQALGEDLTEGTIKVAVIKATLRDVKFAEKENMPLGLYIVKGMVDLNGDYKPDDINNDDIPDKISDIMKYLSEQIENETSISDDLMEAFAKRITILERKAAKEDTQDPAGSDNSTNGKSDTAPGQTKEKPNQESSNNSVG